jgi:DNA-binding winged helix-turn-helix (wHTH) protein
MKVTDEALGGIEFGRFQLLPHRRELRADGVAVELGSRAFDVLMVLTEARGALVTKDEILSRVWPDTVVEENNLVVQISALRKALGEDRDFIRTVSGRGYRFVAEISTSVAASEAETRVDRRAAEEAAQSDPSSNLPTRVSSLIGPETELEKVSDLPARVVDLIDASAAPRRPPRPLLWRLFGFGLVLVVVASFSWIPANRLNSSYAKEALDRPADIAVGLLTQHMPTLVEKAAPHIKRDDYGVLTLAPEFDGEIRYFVERVILTDPSYLGAANKAMAIDPDARSRLFESSAIMERLVRNTVIGAYQDQAEQRILPR